jgi:voltage-gated potassium channel
MWSYLKSLLVHFFERPAFIFLVGLAMTAMVICSALFYWFEFGSNPRVLSYLDAVYFSVTTLCTVGFGDITPVTDAGKILVIFMMLLGTMIFVSFTGVMASAVLELELEYKERFKKKYQ